MPEINENQPATVPDHPEAKAPVRKTMPVVIALVTVPVRIRQMSDAEALEAQLVENLIRAEIHPMEEAQGFRALLALDEPKYSIEQIAAKVGKSPVFVASRLKLTDLVAKAVEAFYADEIGVGHALLLAKLPADQQEQALSACFREVYNGCQKPAALRRDFPPSEMSTVANRVTRSVNHTGGRYRREIFLRPSLSQSWIRANVRSVNLVRISPPEVSSRQRSFSAHVECQIAATNSLKSKNSREGGASPCHCPFSERPF
jgi:hypothetical protein